MLSRANRENINIHGVTAVLQQQIQNNREVNTELQVTRRVVGATLLDIIETWKSYVGSLRSNWPQ
jgi:hypothetical protein